MLVSVDVRLGKRKTKIRSKFAFGFIKCNLVSYYIIPSPVAMVRYKMK